MNYDKGPQMTVRDLTDYLSLLPKDLPIYVGIGDMQAELHYLIPHKNGLCLCPDCYMQNVYENNIKTVLILSSKNNTI